MEEALSSPVERKYQVLMNSLRNKIISGRYTPGQKLPSEADLVKSSGASRITVGRALRELQNLGLVERIAGSGTYVRQVAREDQTYLFGLLIPDLGETEIFEPICRGIANAPETEEHALLWGHTDKNTSKTRQALRLCQQFIERRVSGVFLAPLEFESEAEKINRRILAALSEAGIPVVLLDRRSTRAPERSRPDLVGINNYQAAYVATTHLISLGCTRIGFLGYHGSASTIEDRITGYREALAAHNLAPPPELDDMPEAGNPAADVGSLRGVEGFVCVNDRVAGEFMQVFLAREIRIPEEIRLVGIDDLSYASLLPVPLTTVRQPTQDIGEAALRTMLERIRKPRMSPREVLLDGELIVRKSCGAAI